MVADTGGPVLTVKSAAPASPLDEIQERLARISAMLRKAKPMIVGCARSS